MWKNIQRNLFHRLHIWTYICVVYGLERQDRVVWPFQPTSQVFTAKTVKVIKSNAFRPSSLNSYNSLEREYSVIMSYSAEHGVRARIHLVRLDHSLVCNNSCNQSATEYTFFMYLRYFWLITSIWSSRTYLALSNITENSWQDSRQFSSFVCKHHVIVMIYFFNFLICAYFAQYIDLNTYDTEETWIHQYLLSFVL